VAAAGVLLNFISGKIESKVDVFVLIGGC